SSTDYTLDASVNDAGGSLTTAGPLSCNGSLGCISGTSRFGTDTVNAGFPGEIYNLTGLALSAPSLFLDAGVSMQLSANGLADDASLLTLNPSSVAWSTQDPSNLSISPSGLATAGTVFVNKAGIVEGIYSGFDASFTLVLTNTKFTAWQLRYFG